MVSVIVPVYKVEKYIHKCVESITNQTYNDLEIILVDDGSPDRSGKICDELALTDDRIKVIHQENCGQAAARNRGLQVASGEYVTFVDSDDYISQNFAEFLVKAIEETSSDIAICGYKVINEEEQVVLNSCSSVGGLLDNNELWNEVFGKLNNAVWNKLFRKKLLDGIFFEEDLGHGEDLLFNLTYISKCKKAVKVDSILYFYLKHPGSVTSSAFSDRRFMEIESKDRAKEFIIKNAPKQIINAQKYSFRARMNVIRAIYKDKKEKLYQKQIKELTTYLKDNYNSTKKTLCIKEKIEYRILMSTHKGYSIVVKMLR